MPTPHHGTRGVLDGNDGIAVFDVGGGYVEINEGLITATGHGKIFNQPALVGPYNRGFRGGVGGVLYIDVGRGNFCLVVVFESVEY